MRRSAYKSTSPISPDEILGELEKLNQTREGHRAEVEGLQGKLKEAKTNLDGCTTQIHELLSADHLGIPIYRLRNGTVTTEAPDRQGELVDTE